MPSITDIYLRVFDVIKNAFRVRQVDEAGQDFTPAKEDGNLAGIKTNTDNLDVPLSTRLKKEDLNLDLDKDLQVDVKTMPPVSTEPSFSDAANVPKKALVGANRHVYVDIKDTDLLTRLLINFFSKLRKDSADRLVINVETGTVAATQSGTWTMTQGAGSTAQSWHVSPVPGLLEGQRDYAKMITDIQFQEQIRSHLVFI